MHYFTIRYWNDLKKYNYLQYDNTNNTTRTLLRTMLILQYRLQIDY